MILDVSGAAKLDIDNIDASNLVGLSAELLIASLMVRDGWNIYSPHRDIGLEFIATKKIGDAILMRGVQVRGCHPEARKESARYAKMQMELNERHQEIALVIPFYYASQTYGYPEMVAFMPLCQIWPTANGLFGWEDNVGRVSHI